MRNMLIRPTEAELKDFGEPDFIIYNAGEFPANRFTRGMTSQTSVEINFKRMEMVILGTEYGELGYAVSLYDYCSFFSQAIHSAGEMKKGVFSVMVRLFETTSLIPLTLIDTTHVALSATCEIWHSIIACFR